MNGVKLDQDGSSNPSPKANWDKLELLKKPQFREIQMDSMLEALENEDGGNKEWMFLEEKMEPDETRPKLEFKEIDSFK